MNTLKSTNAVAAAIRATEGLTTTWSEAYAAIAADRQGGATLRDIADGLKRAGVKVSKDLVGDMELAHALTVHGAAFTAAHSKAMQATSRGSGFAIMLPHSLITKARLARGIAYVRATLATLDGLTGDDLIAAMGKAVGTLHAAKREATPDTGEETTGEETAETVSEETVSDATPTTLAEILAAAGSLLAGAEKRLTAGETVTASERDAFMAQAARVAGLLKAETAVAV